MLVYRAEPSMPRAVTMGLVVLPVTGTGCGRSSIRNLNIAIPALLSLNPWLAHSWGFTPSATAYLGVSLGAEPLAGIMAGWAPTWFVETVTVPSAA